jgi:hypothetical protein
MPEPIRKLLPYWIDGGIGVLLIVMIYNTATWKAQIDEQMQQQRQQIAALAAQTVTPETQRRLSIIETDAMHRSREIAELKADLVRRLERQDNKLDQIQQRLERASRQ